MTNSPIFQPVFGESWERMPPVLQRHYANQPYTEDVVTLEGVMDITLSPLTRLVASAQQARFYERLAAGRKAQQVLPK